MPGPQGGRSVATSIDGDEHSVTMKRVIGTRDHHTPNITQISPNVDCSGLFRLA
jgi:hypothetical protein